MEDGRKAEGFSPHRTNNQGGLPPYLRAVLPSDVAGGSAVGPATAGGKAAVIIWQGWTQGGGL